MELSAGAATGPRLTPLVAELPATVPFTGPETLERRFERPMRPRLGANENLFGISPVVLDAMAKAATECGVYGDPDGWELRQALSRCHGVGIEHVVLGSGVDELLGLFVRAYAGPGSPVVMSTGGYPTFTYHVHGFGCALTTVPYRNFANDIEALADAARHQNAAIVYLSNPDNPTGSWHTTEAQTWLLDRLPPTSLLLLDEAYAEFAPPDSIPGMIADPRLVRLRTFSKAQGLAGMRVGYAYGDPRIIRPIDRIRNHFGVGRLAQAAALATLADQGYVRGTVEAVKRGREDYAAIARRYGANPLPSATNFVAIDMGDGDRARLALKYLVEHEGVFIRMPGVAPLDRCIRVTVGPEADRRIFADAFGRFMSLNALP